MVEVDHSGVQTQKRLSAFPPFESLLTAFLSPSGSVVLLNGVVAPIRGDDLLVIDALQAQECSDGSPVAPQPIGVDDLWYVVFTQQAGQEGRRSFGIAMSLQKNIEHETVLV